MAISFRWKLSYQNLLEYEVHGHPFIKRIEAYSVCLYGLLEYQRQTFNGYDAEFERTMVARQGGVIIRSIDKPFNESRFWADHRWPQEFYLAFVQWLKDEHARYLVKHELRRSQCGYTIEEFPTSEMSPIPRPIFYNPDAKTYEVEPWFKPEMASLEPAACLAAV
jgi:hypothetical protein